MCQNQSGPQLGDCFIELGTFWAGMRLLWDNREQCSDFETFCSLIELNTICEAVCLYDTIYIPAMPFSETGDLSRLTTYLNDEFSQELYKNGIIKFHHFSVIIASITSLDTLNRLINEPPSLTLINAMARWRYRVLALLQNKANDIQLRSILRQDDLFYSCLECAHDEFGVCITPGVFGSHIFSGRYDIKGQLYLHLSELFRNEITSLQKLNCPINFYIPPISTIILSRASDRTSFLSELLALRDEFSDFRKKYNNYQREILNPNNKTLRELYSIRNDCFSDLNKSLCHLSGKAGSSWLFEILKAELGFSDDAESFLKGSFNITSLAKIATKGVRIRNIKGRAQILFLLWQKLQEVKDYHKLYEDVFSFRIEQDSMCLLDRYSNLIKACYKGTTGGTAGVAP